MQTESKEKIRRLISTAKDIARADGGPSGHGDPDQWQDDEAEWMYLALEAIESCIIAGKITQLALGCQRVARKIGRPNPSHRQPRPSASVSLRAGPGTAIARAPAG